MIEKLSVLNFKCFDRIEMSGVGPVTLIGGDNSIGKTALLEALLLVYDRVGVGMTLRHWAGRGVRSVPTDTGHLFSPLFRDWDMSRGIVLEATCDPNGPGPRMGERLSIDYDECDVDYIMESRDNGRPTSLRTDEDEGRIPLLTLIREFQDGSASETAELALVGNGPNSLRLRSRAPLDSRARAFFAPVRHTQDPDELSQAFGRLDVMVGQAQRMMPALRVVLPGLKDVDAVALSTGAWLHADLGSGRKVPVNLLGDGFVRLLSFLTGISGAKGGVALLDEVDSGIHYSTKDKFWRALATHARSEDCQIFATTHSYECLRAAVRGLSGDFEKDLCYVRLERDGEQIVPVRSSFEQLSAAIERGWEVR